MTLCWPRRKAFLTQCHRQLGDLDDERRSNFLLPSILATHQDGLFIMRILPKPAREAFDYDPHSYHYLGGRTTCPVMEAPHLSENLGSSVDPR